MSQHYEYYDGERTRKLVTDLSKGAGQVLMKTPRRMVVEVANINTGFPILVPANAASDIWLSGNITDVRLYEVRSKNRIQLEHRKIRHANMVEIQFDCGKCMVLQPSDPEVKISLAEGFYNYRGPATFEGRGLTDLVIYTGDAQRKFVVYWNVYAGLSYGVGFERSPLKVNVINTLITAEEPQKESDMEKNMAALIRKDTHTVQIVFEPRPGVKAVPDGTVPKSYTYIGLKGMALEIGDVVVVDSIHGMSIARITEVDQHVKIEPKAPEKYKFVICKIDLSGYEALLQENDKIDGVVAEAYRNQMQEGFRAATLNMLNAEALAQLPTSVR